MLATLKNNTLGLGALLFNLEVRDPHRKIELVALYILGGLECLEMPLRAKTKRLKLLTWDLNLVFDRCCSIWRARTIIGR